jgi:hypothetical protein
MRVAAGMGMGNYFTFFCVGFGEPSYRPEVIGKSVAEATAVVKADGFGRIAKVEAGGDDL